MKPGDIEYILNHKDFVAAHLGENPFELALKHGSEPGKKLLIGQVQARQKIRKKLPEWYANLDLIFPPGLSLEQASSEATARLKSRLISGKSLLDITGGLGVDCFYLSNAFATATYVERDTELAQLANYNFGQLGAPIHTIEGDGVGILKSSGADVVYADPYRRDESRKKMVALSDCIPDVTTLIPDLIKAGRTSLIKASPMLDLRLAIEQLQYVREIWIISHRNDCKEIVFVLHENAEEIVVKTFDLYPGSENHFSFEWTAKQGFKAETGELQTYLYEPNASVMKFGGQDLLALDFDLKKLHPNSNIFTSGQFHPGFPGRVFKVKQEMKAMDKSLRKGRFNVISRNFPKKASEIEKKLQLKPSQNDYLLATRLQDGSYAFIVGKIVT